MIKTMFFEDTQLMDLERKIAFYFRTHARHLMLNVDICSAFDPRDNQMHYTAAVMYEVANEDA